MTNPKEPARPSQVTMAGWMAIVGSVLLVVTLYQSVGSLQSVETRESISKFLSKPPGDGLGLSVSGAISVLRGLMLFAGAAAAAAAVLGAYVLQRHQGARIGFTIAAAVLLLTAPVSGGFLALVIVFCAVTLWRQPARDWFAGRTPAAAVSKPSRQADSHQVDPQQADSHQVDPHQVDPHQVDPHQVDPHRASAPAPDQDGAPVRSGYGPQTGPHPTPPPTEGFGTPSSERVSGAPGSEQTDSSAQQAPAPAGFSRPGDIVPAGDVPQSGQQHYGYFGQTNPDKRPAGVVIAAVLTWVFAGVTALLYALIIGVLLIAKDSLIELLRDDERFAELDASTNQVVAALWVMSAIVIFWCLAAMVLAFLAFKRHNWARIVLIVSAGTSVLMGLLAFPVSILHVLAAVAAIVLLLVGDTGRWFSAKSAPSLAPYQPQGPYLPQNPQQQPQQALRRKDEKEPPSNVW